MTERLSSSACCRASHSGYGGGDPGAANEQRRPAHPTCGCRASLDSRSSRRETTPSCGPPGDLRQLAALRSRLPDVTEAPLADEADTAEFWRGSPLQTAVSRVQDELRRTAEDGDLVIAVTDERDPHPVDLRRPGDATQGRDRQLRPRRPVGRGQRRHQRARHRRPHGRALDGLQRRALRRGRPQLGLLGRARASTRSTGRPLGVIDLSTTWDRTHPIGLATARVMARLIEGALPTDRRTTLRGISAPTEPGLTLTLLGTAEVWLDGQRLLLNRRQTEILALLALHPEGLSVEQLHSLLYGDSGDHLHAQGGGLPPPPPSGPALLAALSPHAAGHHRHRQVQRAAPPRRRTRGGRGLRRRPAARGRTRRRWCEMGDYLAVERARGAAGRPGSRRGAALQRAGAVRHRGGRGVPAALGRRTTRRRPC